MKISHVRTTIRVLPSTPSFALYHIAHGSLTCISSLKLKIHQYKLDG